MPNLILKKIKFTFLKYAALGWCLFICIGCADIQSPLDGSTFIVGETITFRGSVLYNGEEEPTGDLRTIGFWKHQAAVATGNSRGKAQIDAETLASSRRLRRFIWRR